MQIAQLLATYDRQVRGSFHRRVPSTWTAITTGPLTCCRTEQGGFVLADDGLRGWSRARIDELVDATTRLYADEPLGFEWKTFSHDNPDVVASLAAHGFVAGEPETLILGDVDALTGPELSVPPITIRDGHLADLPAVAAMEEAVWDEPWDWFVPEMTGRLTDAEPTYLTLAEAPTDDGPLVVSAAWLVPMPGTEVAGLWGGSTLAGYRGRGIYKALVRRRANEAARRGVRLLQVDATEDSRPILERLGLTAVGTTTPYRWTPAA